MTPKLTVLIPVRNGMPYLTETLASLAVQTEHAFEVLLWDNGSTDGTVVEAKKWIPNQLPGRVVESNPLPLHLCLATMVIEAKTEFCARLDADDQCHPERFARQLQALAADCNLAALGSQAEFVNEFGVRTGARSAFPLKFSDILSGMLVQNELLHPSIMFRRQAVLAAGNYTAEKPCEDYDLWMKVSLSARLGNLAEPLLLYRLHSNSIIAKARHANQLAEPNLRCQEHRCSALFGLKPATYRKLIQKEHLLSFWPLIATAIRIARRSGVPVAQVLRSPFFLYSAGCMTAKVDFLSRVVWGVLRRLGLPKVTR